MNTRSLINIIILSFLCLSSCTVSKISNIYKNLPLSDNTKPMIEGELELQSPFQNNISFGIKSIIPIFNKHDKVNNDDVTKYINDLVDGADPYQKLLDDIELTLDSIEMNYNEIQTKMQSDKLEKTDIKHIETFMRVINICSLNYHKSLYQLKELGHAVDPHKIHSVSNSFTESIKLFDDLIN